jgi:signal transduction histidine kinase
MMRQRFSRLSLLWKVLLSTSVAVTGLFAVTGVIVLGNISRTVSDSLEQEVRTSFQAYTSLWNTRVKWLESVSSLVSTMQYVRSAFSTGDRATIQDVAGDLWSKISQEDPLFLVTNARGKVVASLGGWSSLFEKNLSVVEAAAPRFPDQSSGFFLQDGELYHIAVTPVYVDSTQGQELLDVLVAGYHVDAVVAGELKKSTGGSEFLFLAQGRVIASTLNPRATKAVMTHVSAHNAAAPSEGHVSDGVVEYAQLTTPLFDITHKPVGEICILRSFEDAQRRLSRMKTNFVLLWMGAVLLGLLLSFLLARRIVEPVKQLDRAAAEVARQNYAIEVKVNSQDEMGRLARSFNSMCASLRKAREDLIRQERISTIGRLSGSIVHDLRNPLAAIYGGAEMMVDGDLPPAHVKRLAANIYRASRRIQELLQDLLNVSRGKSAAPESCRLREVAAAACDSLAAAADAQGVAIILEIAPEIELPLERNRMERAFVNLIGNALEAMPGGGQVRLSARLDAGMALVEVADNGPGIAAEIRSQLFQPFVSAGKRNGLGLGLALTRQTVLEHGGDMWVESEPGRGARFLFRLPGAHAVHAVGQAV